jgi:hypothetical protein
MRQRLRLRIRYDHGADLAALLIAALLTTSFLAYLAWGGAGISSADAQSAEASSASAAGTREFYLTRSTHNGGDADAACEPGYHMASLWETLDPSNLKYNSHLGATDLDSGQGPPSDPAGWIRTGGSTSGAVPGYANCQGYTTNASGQQGTTVWLDTTWNGSGAGIHVWEATTWSCASSSRVWCVEDSALHTIYLPVVARSV